MSTSTDFPEIPLPLPLASAVTLPARAGERPRATEPAERSATAHPGAMRAVRGGPHRGRAKPAGVRVLFCGPAPEMRERATYFASCSATRAAVQAGTTRRVTPRSADDPVRQARQFADPVNVIRYEDGL